LVTRFRVAVIAASAGVGAGNDRAVHRLTPGEPPSPSLRCTGDEPDRVLDGRCPRYRRVAAGHRQDAPHRRGRRSCLGGVSEDEYHNSGPRIADYLAREPSPRRRWEPPEPDARRPEAEWGFDPTLRSDLEQLAAVHGYQLRRLVTEEPQQLSEFVADLHRWWYRRRALPGQRLLVQSYVQWDPLWTQRLGAVPFWIRFNIQPSFDDLHRYLERVEAYDHIHVNLFSQGLWSPGVVPVRHWRNLAESAAAVRGDVIGVDEHAYPLDTGSTMRYQPAFAALPPRHPLPAPLAITDIENFLDTADTPYQLTWS
jgi:hypothetical protein